MFKFTLFLCLGILFLAGCGGPCSTDQEYSAQFTLIDHRTGESYFTGLTDHNINSLQFFEESLTNPPIPMMHYIRPGGEIYFASVELLNVANKTYYLRFSSKDIDTLVINSQITPFRGPEQCQFFRHATKIYYNGHLVKEAMSDTSGIVSVQLRR